MSTWFGNSAVAASRANLDLVPNIYFDPQDYGLVAGTSSDILSPLQAALTAASTPGGTVILPSGFYNLSGGLVIPATVLLKGTGNTTLNLIDGHTGGLTLVQCLGGAEQLIINGNKNLTTGAVIGFQLVGLYARNITVQSCNGIGANIVGGAYCFVDTLIASDNVGDGISCIGTAIVQMRNLVTFSNQGSGLVLNNSASVYNIDNVSAQFNSLDGIYITGRQIAGVTLNNFVCKQNTVCGLELTDSDLMQFSNGRCEGNGANGVATESARWHNFSNVHCVNNSQTTNGAEEEWFFGDDGGGSIYSIENTLNGCSATINGAKKANYAFREAVGSGPNWINGGKYDIGTVDNVVFQHTNSRVTGAGKVRDTDDPETSVSVNYAVLKTDYYIRVTTGVGVITITLPSPLGTRYAFIVMKADAGAGTVNIVSGGSGHTLNGVASLSLTTRFQSTLCISNGSDYECS